MNTKRDLPLKPPPFLRMEEESELGQSADSSVSSNPASSPASGSASGPVPRPFRAVESESGVRAAPSAGMGEALDGLLSGINSLLASRPAPAQIVVSPASPAPAPLSPEPAATLPVPPEPPVCVSHVPVSLSPEPPVLSRAGTQAAVHQQAVHQQAQSFGDLGSLMGLLSSALHAPGSSPDLARTSLSFLRHLALMRAVPVPERLRSRGDPRVSPRLSVWLERLPSIRGAHVWASEDGQRLFYAEPIEATAEGERAPSDEIWLAARAALAPLGALARLEHGQSDHFVLSLPTLPEFCFCRRLPGPEGLLRAVVSPDEIGEPAVVAWPDSPLEGCVQTLAAAWLSGHRRSLPLAIVSGASAPLRAA